MYALFLVLLFATLILQCFSVFENTISSPDQQRLEKIQQNFRAKFTAIFSEIFEENLPTRNMSDTMSPSPAPARSYCGFG